MKKPVTQCIVAIIISELTKLVQYKTCFIAYLKNV